MTDEAAHQRSHVLLHAHLCRCLLPQRFQPGPHALLGCQPGLQRIQLLKLVLYPGTHLPQDPGKIAGTDGLLEAIERIARPQPHLALLQLMRRAISAYAQTNGVQAAAFEARLRALVERYNTRDKLVFTSAAAAQFVDDLSGRVIDLMEELQMQRTEAARLGGSAEEQAFFDILVAVRDAHGFPYADEKCRTLACAIKEMVDAQTQFVDWSQRADVKAEMNVKMTVLLYQHGYPPQWREEELHAWLEERFNALRLANAIIYGWGGVPVIWSGDELGQFNDPNWDTEPGHESDSRWSGRPVLDESRVERRHDRSTVEGRVFTDLAHLGEVRASLPQLSANVRTVVAPVDDEGVLVTYRDHPRGSFVGVYNVTPDWRSVPAWRLAEYGVLGAVDVLTGTVPSDSTTLEGSGDGQVPVPPYAAWWLVRSTD